AANGGSVSEQSAANGGSVSEQSAANGDAAGGKPTALTDFGTAEGDDEDDEVGGDAGGETGEDAEDGEASAEGGAEPEGVVATAESDDDEDAVEIVVDQRELDSTIARDLSTREGVRTRLETLEVGDYVLSDRVAVERKSVADFLDTLVGEDRSLFEQARALSRHYARPVVIVEGDDLYGERNVHPGAIRGALASLAVDYGMSVLRTEDEGDTADMLEVVATREQRTRDRQVSVHGQKSAKTLPEQQEYVVSSIADIGPVTARSLLEAFGTVEAVMTARTDDLLEVDGVGEVTAERIREVVGSDYE
ncbi:MAG: ERCC4 domain-containing protein, partial [Haloferacaceae archaeon]